jgi:hypothetical protein
MSAATGGKNHHPAPGKKACEIRGQARRNISQTMVAECEKKWSAHPPTANASNVASPIMCLEIPPARLILDFDCFQNAL